MKTLFLSAVATLFILSALPACTDVPLNAVPPVSANGWAVPSKKTMRAFGSEQELARYFKELAEKQRRELKRAAATALYDSQPAAPASSAEMSAAKSKDDESVTNVQHAGVDEGGIVKLHGDHLVVLRRGRLFTVRIGDGDLKPISSVDAFGPDIDPRATWYDEMLVSEDTIAVIGYSYERGGTEVGLFQIDPQGNLQYRSTYHLRSNDYYSSRNYASRLIGSKLIFYTPLYLSPGADDPSQSFPAVRKWHKGATPAEFQRIVSATRVYRPEHNIDVTSGLALHTVTVCDLSGGDFKCEATGVLASPGRVFYVSPESVYVWTTGWTRDSRSARAQSMLYRLPLNGSSPSALGVSGSPVDQFSFLESGDGFLNVLVRAGSYGEAMWSSEAAAGDVSLMRVRLTSFNDGTESTVGSDYQMLPKPEGYTFQNRFVGDYLLYGSGSGWGYPQQSGKSNLYAVRWIGSEAQTVQLKHGVDRIEQMGSDAVVVGTDGKNLHFTSIRLGETAEVVGHYIREGASQGELRSHGFFYKADGQDSGTLGLPISVPGRPGYRHLFETSASILFLRNRSLQFEEVGELDARPERAVNDACRASCVDWYGNARPLFVRGRVFALLGYEIVEGAMDFGRMRELRRVSYAPGRIEITRN
jgi:hypothetical protein